jgi:hypothetical protein
VVTSALAVAVRVTPLPVGTPDVLVLIETDSHETLTALELALVIGSGQPVPLHRM